MTDPAAVATTLLVEMGQVKGQLAAMTDLLRQNHTATQTRIEDLSKSVGVQFDDVKNRLTTLEANERGTALRAAGSGGLAGAIVAAAFAALKVLGH
jgi:hypothetical protein